MDLYGKVLNAPNPINFNLTNSILHTEWITQGIRLKADCSQTVENHYNGLVLFKNFTMIGERYLEVKDPLVMIETPYNITFDQAELIN